jgi:ankyrin repeat protein
MFFKPAHKRWRHDIFDRKFLSLVRKIFVKCGVGFKIKFSLNLNGGCNMATEQYKKAAIRGGTEDEKMETPILDDTLTLSLIDAIKKRNSKKITNLLHDERINLEAVDDKGNNLLQLAIGSMPHKRYERIFAQSLELIAILLAKGVNVNHKNIDGLTAFHLAAQLGDKLDHNDNLEHHDLYYPEILALLLNQHANPLVIKDNLNQNALERVVMSSPQKKDIQDVKKTITLLWNAGFRLSGTFMEVATSKEWSRKIFAGLVDTPLIIEALKKNDWDQMHHFAENGTLDIFVKDVDGKTLFDLATDEEGDLKKWKQAMLPLINRAVLEAVQNGDLDTIKHFVEDWGVDISIIKSLKNDSLLHLAVKNSHLSVVAYLLENYPQTVDDVNDFGQTPLFSILDKELYQFKLLVTLFLNNSANVLHKDKYRRTILSYAVESELIHPEILKIIFNAQANHAYAALQDNQFNLQQFVEIKQLAGWAGIYDKLPTHITTNTPAQKILYLLRQSLESGGDIKKLMVLIDIAIDTGMRGHITPEESEIFTKLILSKYEIFQMMESLPSPCESKSGEIDLGSSVELSPLHLNALRNLSVSESKGEEKTPKSPITVFFKGKGIRSYDSVPSGQQEFANPYTTESSLSPMEQRGPQQPTPEPTVKTFQRT